MQELVDTIPRMVSQRLICKSHPTARLVHHCMTIQIPDPGEATEKLPGKSPSCDR